MAPLADINSEDISLINPISNAASVYAMQGTSSKAPQQSAAKPAEQQQDSVQLSPQAQAALAASQDRDHDGDSH